MTELPKIGTEGWKIVYPGQIGEKVYISKATIRCIFIDQSGVYYLPGDMSGKHNRIYLTKQEADTALKEYVEYMEKFHNRQFVVDETKSFVLVGYKGR
ncbi:MAG: hypothetical protein PWP15_1140 [Methanothermococcus sp.]|uniref:hypothetical protein n=1 Tax=Methanothermococcus sp. TaxID=2614238 RepID=UPI0025884EFF|nr:hypothetical protein [Methanothermococcus sp.]MDK2790633.1 hypothetical protein [Methanothermococcus sp.]